MTLQRFALIYGIVFVVVGILGFVPGITTPHSHPDVELTTSMGLVLGLFPVNALHNLVHLAFGIWGLIAARGVVAARVYARAVAVIYALLTVMGLIPAADLYTTFGLVPLYGHDIWLHAVLAIVAGYFGFAYQERRVVPT